MEEKIQTAINNVLGDHWQCIWNESGCHIVHIKNTKPRAGIFCERAWLVLFFRQGDVMIESKRAYVSRSIPAISGDRRVVRLCFEEMYSDVFVDLDDQPLPEGSIERLSFFAKTDSGTFVITVNPGFAKDARPVTVLVSHRDKVNQTLQAMAVDWFYEIFSK